MTTAICDHNITRGDPFRPALLTLTAKNDAGETIDVPAVAFSDLACTVRKKPALLQPDNSDADVVARVTLVSNSHGVISVVGANQVQILIHGSITRLWTDQNEYFYDVEGILVSDGEPYTVVKGRIAVGWDVGR